MDIKTIKNKFFEDKKEKFKNIIDFAELLLENTNSLEERSFQKEINYKEHPLVDLVRLLGRNVQSKYLTNLLYVDKVMGYRDINFSDLMFGQDEYITKNNEDIYDLKQKVHDKRDIDLSRDLILPWPWNRTRLCSCLSTIGEGRVSGNWQEDKSNHNIELWLPVGITWVLGGNHSITVGIIQGKGKVTTNYIYDISKVYDYVYCDGKNYVRKSDNHIISPVENIDFAAIFEIGRIMKREGISF